MVEYNKEQIERSTQGFYRTGAFHIFLKGKFDQDISRLSVDDQGTFLHEYIHFLQNISTPWGILVGATRNSEIVEDFQSIAKEQDIPIPYNKTIHSKQLQSRLNWIKTMDGFTQFPDNLEWNVDKVIKLGIADLNVSGRNGKCMIIIARIVGYYKANRIELSEETVYNLLNSKHSIYINEEELVVWSQAITEIISGNAIIGAYALMPQLEKLIRQLAESKIGDTTHLANNIQDEKTFGTIITELKSYMNEDFNRELSLFLTDRVDVGLRNAIMHGLATPFEVQMYSVIILYLSLKLFILEDKFLFIDEIK